MRISTCLFVLLMTSIAVAGSPPGSFEGPVLETIDAGSYTYVRIDSEQGPVWAAAPHFVAEVGQVARFPSGMRMDAYHSKTLDRTFDAVYFVSAVEVVGQAAPPRASDGKASDITRAEGGRTIAEVMDQRQELAGKTVRIRGEVVRATDGVMGKNWLHLRDGSVAEDGSADLTVTTAGSAKVGDTVVVEGKVAVDRSFGHGYDYPVMVEDATCTVE